MHEFPPFRLDTINQCLWRRRDSGEDERILLSPKVYSVLRYLVEHAGRLVTEKELLDAVWPRTYVEPQAVKQQVFEIRKVLGDSAKTPRYIETLQRRGYQFIASVREGPAVNPVMAEPPADRIVGRERPLAELRDRLSSASVGRRQIVFVSGEVGIGKTALVDEFQRQAVIEVPGIRIARGQCIEGYGGKEAYFPVLEAIGQLCCGPESAFVVDVLASQAPTWLVQFPVMLKREHEERLRQEILGATRERMLREIGVALDTIAAQLPLLLVFEDLQWVDHSTVDLLSMLARRQTPAKLMLVATTRPVVDITPLKELEQELLLHQLCHEVELGPLPESAVAEYLADQSGDAKVPNELAGLIYRHTEGNPLFMVAALDHLTRRGLISREGGTWQLGVPLKEIDFGVPETLRQMIEIQVGRLSAEEQRALAAAGIAGVMFAASIGAVAFEGAPEEFEDLCESLAHRHRIIRRAGNQAFPDGSISPRYEFVHALYREVVYLGHARLRQTKMHRQVGEKLEALYALRLSDVAQELAYHFEQGADWLRAVKYLQLAADAAEQRYADREALALLQHALGLSSKLPDAPRFENETRILEKQATICAVSFGTIERAVESYESIVARAHQHGQIQLEVRALIDMAYPLNWLDSRRCAEVASEALRLSAKQPDLLLRAKARASCLYWQSWSVGWSSQTFEEFGSALADLRHAAGDDQAVFVLDLLGYGLLQWASSRYRDANRSAAEALQIALGAGAQNPYFKPAYVRAANLVSQTLVFSGEWGEALRAVKAGLTIVQKNDDEFRAQTLRLWSAWVHLHAMDFVAVRNFCQSALRLFGDPVRSPHSCVCLILAGHAAVGLRDYVCAFEHLSAARRAMDSSRINLWYLRPHLELAITDLWIASGGSTTQARSQSEHFLEVALAGPERAYQALAWDAKARIAITELDYKRAQEFIANATSTIEGFEVPLAAWRVHATAAELYALIGHQTKAKRYRELSRVTILKLADSLLPEETPLRETFLAAPAISRVLASD